ncbi:hypothetical protein [Marinobacter apostichopi]|uniref:hypothetical protein n=1 Tax=Marinobacter apostichopi TaxID=3035454 RepID=UPI002572DC1D|nr:hypothetical protein [Marinobacter sp. LA51]
MTGKIRDDAVWITWEKQTRNRSASSYFDVPLFEIIDDGSYRIARYLKSISKTVAIINRQRPRYFFAQNPSVVLALLAVSIGPLLRCKVIIDAHNAGIHGPERSNPLVRKLNRFIIRKANAVIVTNAELASYASSLGGNPIVLPDPLPLFTEDKGTAVEDRTSTLKALCITSWSDDEPLLEILEAAKKFEDEIVFYFSGNFRKTPHLIPNKLPANVNLLGYVDEAEFHRHLFSADFCIDMTKRSDCMVCGAYESISAEKPVILSDTPVQRSYFSKGTVFSKNSSMEIADAIKVMRNNLATMKMEAAQLKNEILKQEKNSKVSILLKIQQL